MIKLKNQTQTLIRIFIICVVLSGLTAFPLEWELSLLARACESLNLNNDLSRWITLVYAGLRETNRNFPFLAYGTDWLAFAHLIIAIAFLGPLRDPVRNRWVIEFGLIACAGIFPLAFIAGHVRGIPFYWTLIDCSFGVGGAFLLGKCYANIKKLEAHHSLQKFK